MKNKLQIIIFLCLFFGINSIHAGNLPSFKVDINDCGRPAVKENAASFSPLTFPQTKVVVDTLINPSFSSDTVLVTLRGLTMNNADTLLWTNYYKAGMQSAASDAKLTLDGAFSRVIEMTIHGLPAGTNSLLTYHNNVNNKTAYTYNPIKIYVNGKLVVDHLMPSVRELNRSKVPLSYLKFNVVPGKDVVIKFVPVLVHGVNGVKPFNCVPLNGFEINTPDALHQAHNPYPVDKNQHVNGDNGKITLRWSKAANAVSHHLYWGTDSAAVANASTSSPVFRGNKALNDTTYTVKAYSMNKYYWRVDEVSSNGTVTKGDTWYYRPRHLAFPGAEGYGRLAIGGRGGIVVHVTNLNDSGPGSFRYAVLHHYGVPRTVIFDVSGIIYLKSRLIIGPYTTIAGQTAPGKGICFRAAPIGINRDCICRFIRMRLGAGKTYDGIGMAGADNSIVDHCSISWTIDEAFSSRNAKNITLQRTMISEALNIAGHKKYAKGKEHGYAGSIGGNCGSFHHNLLADNEGRNWSMAGGLDGNGYYAGKLDLFNNVVYNYGGRATDGGVHEGNFVNNYYKKGPSTSINFIFNAQLQGTGKGTQSYYYSGNVEANQNGTLECDGTDNTCGRRYSISGGQILNWKLFVNKPFFPSYAKIQTAQNAYKSVLSDVGCTMPVIDNHDKRIIYETQNGTYTYVGSVSGLKGLIDNQADAGGYENYPHLIRPAHFDTDGDGLPDWWERLHGTNPDSPKGDFSDANADTNKDGYTSLEDYLEWMSVPHYYLQKANKTATIDLARFSVGYTKHPVYTLENKEKGLHVSLNDSIAKVTANTVTPGIYYLNFKTTDADHSTIVRKIGICVGAKGITDVNMYKTSSK